MVTELSAKEQRLQELRARRQRLKTSITFVRGEYLAQGKILAAGKRTKTVGKVQARLERTRKELAEQQAELGTIESEIFELENGP